MDVERLKELMAQHGERPADIARLLDLAPDKVSKTLSGKRRLQVSEANILRDYFAHVNTGERFDGPTLLPVVGLVSAGSWREGFEQVIDYMPSPDRRLGKNAFVVLVDGDSMNKVVQDGESVIVDPAERELIAGRYYVVRNDAGETTFKKYCENPARLEPCSDNPEHAVIFPGQNGFEVIGRVRKRVSDL